MNWRLAVPALLIAYTIFQVAGLAPAGKSAHGPLDCAGAISNVKLALERHYLRPQLDARLTTQVISRYRELLLSQRALMSASEIAAIEKSPGANEAAAVAIQLREGSCEFFEEKARVLQAVLERAKLALGTPQQLARKIERAPVLAASASAALSAVAKPAPSGGAASIAALAGEISEWKGFASKDATARFLALRHLNKFERLGAAAQAIAYEGLVRSAVQSLDPFSNFFNEAETAALTASALAGSYSGVGVLLTRATPHGAQILRTIEGGAAAESGQIHADDVITRVDGRAIVGLELEQLHPLLTGPAGSQVTLTVARVESGALVAPRDVLLKRKNVAQSSNALEASRKTIDGSNIVTIRLSKFYDGCAADVRNELVAQIDAMKSAGGINSLVLDLRGNIGGMRDEATRLAGLFIGTGPVFGVRERGEAGAAASDVIAADDDGTKYDGPVVVAIDKATASAAELVAGALKDYRRALVVGDERSLGKGTTQRIFMKGDGVVGGSLSITIGQLYTPSGSSTQETGVKSDIVVNGPKARARTVGDLKSNPIRFALFKPLLSDEQLAQNADSAIEALAPALQAQSALRLMAKPTPALSEEAQSAEILNVAADLAKLKSGG